MCGKRPCGGTCGTRRGTTCAENTPPAGHVAHTEAPHVRETPRQRDMWCGGRHHMRRKRPGSGTCGTCGGATCAGGAPPAGHVAHTEAPHVRETPRQRDMWHTRRHHMCGKRPISGTCGTCGGATCAESAPAAGHVVRREAPHGRAEEQGRVGRAAKGADARSKSLHHPRDIRIRERKNPGDLMRVSTETPPDLFHQLGLLHFIQIVNPDLSE